MRTLEDKDYVGNSGIDTQLERDHINYVPSIEQLEKRTTGNSSPGNNDSGTSLEPNEDAPYPVSNTYIKVGNAYSFVTVLVSQLQSEFKNTHIPISSEWLDTVLASDVKIDGLDRITLDKGIPFDIYDKAIENTENPTYSLIQDAVEAYAEDIDGSIKLELYPDAKELQINLEELHYVLGNTLYSHLVDSAQIPEKPTIDETFYNALQKQEGKQEEAFTALKDLHSLNEKIYYNLLTTAFESDEYFDALTSYQVTKREHDDFSRRMNQQSDFVSFAETDSGLSYKCARRMNRKIISGSDVSEEEVKALLTKQYEDNTDYKRACSQMQAAMKLQINKQIENKKQQKDVLKTTGGLALKKRVHDEVINLTSIRNDVFLDLYGMMNNMVEPTRSDDVESFLNQVSEGMELVRDNYKLYLQEMYQVHMIDQEIRFDKVNLVGDKQIARDGYWLLDNLLK